MKPRRPERSKAGPGSGRTERGTIKHILDVVIEKFNGNPTRIYASGFSRGGLGALELAQQLKGREIAKLVLVDSEPWPSAFPDIPTWVHYGGPNTLKNIVEKHQELIKQLGNGWESAPPDAPGPCGRRVFTDWNLKLPDRTKNHTETCRRAYSVLRVYEWLLAQPRSA